MSTNNNQLWYTRRGKEIRGPFPKKLITRYILIGRVLERDEVSNDQRTWQPVSALPELIPEELKADLSVPENMEKLRLARMREDERRYGDRRQLSDAELEEAIRKRRSGKERRDSETIETLRHRLIKTKTNQLLRENKKSYRKVAIALSLGVALILGIAMIYSPAPQVVAENHCELAAQPEVDWSNCRLEGLQLMAVDLHGARLQNTSFIAAQLRGANLSQAQMSYSNLLNADVSDANMVNAILVGAVLRKANLNAANLQGSDLRYAILQDVDLSNANLRDANMAHVILTGANITNTNFNGAKLDNAIWLDNTICAPGSIGRCVTLQDNKQN
ncbi:MAG: pentapeptide repeat-containing protein [Gammaproteobacteria bacterium]|jgi:hypothetical protein|nr:pentapeptide repeat-containing protein [Gammaproteobacteria bacterium]